VTKQSAKIRSYPIQIDTWAAARQWKLTMADAEAVGPKRPKRRRSRRRFATAMLGYGALLAAILALIFRANV
jgi:hypothetical protein